MPVTAKSQPSQTTRCSGVADKLQRLIAEARAVMQQGEPARAA